MKLLGLSILLTTISPLFLNNFQAKEKRIINPDTDMSSVSLLDGESIDTSNIFYDDFDSGISSSNWYISKRVWGENAEYGRYNGGVRPENVFVENGVVTLRALGNQYAEKGVTGFSTHTDGSCTGAALVYKGNANPGRYEVRMKISPRVGVCSAFWTYNEDGNGKNHEIDIELPFKNANNNNTFKNVVFTNYIGETNYQQTSQELATALNDDSYHTYAFDWYYSSSHKVIRYYIDGVLYAEHSNASKMPHITSRLWLGCWIPNNVDFVGLPDFDKSYMDIDYVKYSPFLSQVHDAGSAGSPGGAASAGEYPSSGLNEQRNYFPNGTFNYINNRNEAEYFNFGINKSGTVSLSKSYDYAGSNTSGGALLSSSSEINAKIDSVYKNHSYNFSFNYQGKGTARVDYYNESDSLLSHDDIVLDSDTYTTYNTIFTAPNNCFYVKVRFISDTSLKLDNIYVGREEVIPPEPEENPISDGCGFLTHNNSGVSALSSSFNEASFSPYDDENMSWRGSHIRKYNNTVTMGQATTADTIIDKSKGDIFDNIADVLIGESETHVTQAMYMEFDIEEFVDISLYFSLLCYGEPTSQQIRILYSIDHGASWVNLKQSNMGALLNNDNHGTYDQYVFRATSSDLGAIEYDHIRFAFTLTVWTNGVNEHRLNGIIINNKADFMNRLDGATCSYNQGERDLLELEYDNLSASDITYLSSTSMKHYAKTYIEGYDYLVDYWSENPTLSSLNLVINQDSSTILLLIIISIFVLGLVFFVYHMVFKRQ